MLLFIILVIPFIIFMYRANTPEDFWNIMLTCLGLPLAIWLVTYIFKEKEVKKESLGQSSSYEEYKPTIRNEIINSTFDKGSNLYYVTYLSGHNGIDHYLSFYAHKTFLKGELVINEEGVTFKSVSTRTPQKFRLLWPDIISIEKGPPGSKLFRVNSKRHGGINFSVISEYDLKTVLELITMTLIEQRTKSETRQRLEDTLIAQRRIDEISPVAFEHLIEKLMIQMGYRVIHTGKTGDEGVDLIGTNWNGEKVIVQCKRYKNKLGVEIIRGFYGAVIAQKAREGILVTSGEFTKPAIEFAQGKPIRLIDRYELANLLEQYNQ